MSEAADGELVEQLHKKSKKYFKCMTCAGNPIKEKTHFVGGRHVKEALSGEERQEWVLKQFDIAQGGPEIEQQHAQAEVARVRASAPIAAPIDGSVYRLDFGKFSGKSVSEVLKIDADYFAKVVQQTPKSQTPLARKPLLLATLKDFGVWERTLSRGRELNTAYHKKTLEREESGTHMALHHEAQALHRMNVTAARAAQDEEGVEVGVGVAAIVRDAAQSAKSRRSRAFAGSRATRFVKKMHALRTPWMHHKQMPYEDRFAEA